MGTTLDIDEDVFTFLEHEFRDEIECDETGCTNAPEWTMTKTCCNTVFLICSRCKKNILLFIAKLIIGGGMKCYDCNQTITPEQIVFARM